jgi:hypothetical protein
MLSNFQTDDKSLLQTFLLGQPEFRRTLHSPGMQQLRQRVIASYHLGPMDADETRAYIEHRLHTVGWNGDPSLRRGLRGRLQHTGGIPRKHQRAVRPPAPDGLPGRDQAPPEDDDFAPAGQLLHPAVYDTIALEHMDARISGLERSVMSVLDAMKTMLGQRRAGNPQPQEKQQ